MPPRAALVAAGLALGTITPRNDPALAAGTVISADQAAGTEVAVGTAVNLVVASGRVTINDVTGYTVDAATRELEDLGLVVTTQEDTVVPRGGAADRRLAVAPARRRADPLADHAELLLRRLIASGSAARVQRAHRGPRHP